MDGAVPAEARCLLFEPRKGGSGGGGEETSGQARSLGWAPGSMWCEHSPVSILPVASRGGWRSHISKVAASSAPSSRCKLPG